MATVIDGEILTQPVQNYLQIACPFNKENKLKFPHHCWLACGLVCAAKCSRFPNEMCKGCPCSEEGRK